MPESYSRFTFSFLRNLHPHLYSDGIISSKRGLNKYFQWDSFSIGNSKCVMDNIKIGYYVYHEGLCSLTYEGLCINTVKIVFRG